MPCSPQRFVAPSGANAPHDDDLTVVARAGDGGGSGLSFMVVGSPGENVPVTMVAPPAATDSGAAPNASGSALDGTVIVMDLVLDNSGEAKVVCTQGTCSAGTASNNLMQLKNDDGAAAPPDDDDQVLPLVWPKPNSLARTAAGDVAVFGPIAGHCEGPEVATLCKRYVFDAESIVFRHGQPTQQGAGTKLTVTCKNASVLPGLDQDEGYELATSVGAISITAATPAGVLYTCETLSQLLVFDPAAGSYKVPAVHVSDRPRFPHRQLMVDAARFYMPTAMLRSVMDALVICKLNVLHLHVTDSESFPLVIKSRPEFAQLAFSPNERYTLEELAALAEFGRSRNIRLVVEVDVPSHTGDQALCTATGKGCGWCAIHPTTCPSPRCSHNALNPAVNLTYEILDDIIRELSAALPDAYLHFGGDEVLQDRLFPHDCWENDVQIGSWMNATFEPAGRDPRGANGAVEYFNQKVEHMAAARGKRSIRWEEAWYYSCCAAPTMTDPCPGGFVPGCKRSRKNIVHHWQAGNAWWQQPESNHSLVNLTTSNGYDVVTSAGWYLPGKFSRRRDCHLMAPPCAFIRCLNRDKQGVSSK